MTEAELGVIGCVLIDNNSLDKIYTKLKPDMFSTEFCQDAYQQILAIYDRGENVNIMSLSQAMENHKHDPGQIRTVLSDCLISAPTSVMIGSYADTIIKEYRSREVASLFHHVSLKPCDIDDTIGTILTRIELLKDNKQTNIKSMKQIVTENKDNYFNDQVGEGGVKTGFYNLDDCLGRFCRFLLRGLLRIRCSRPRPCGRVFHRHLSFCGYGFRLRGHCRQDRRILRDRSPDRRIDLLSLSACGKFSSGRREGG